MSIKLGVIMDPIEGIKVSKDSTFAMLLEAQKRGYEIHYLQARDLFLKDDAVMANTVQIHVQDQASNWFEASASAQLEMSYFDVVLMRKDPPFDMEYLYFYKSCDVKLMRALIYREKPALEELLPQRDWLAYDMITELNDDIEDMFEDIRTFNGNRIIFEVAVLGADATYRHYQQYLEQVISAYRQQQVAPPEQGASRKVYELTLKAANDTLMLLSHQFAREDVGDISRARVLKKFKYKSA